MATIAKPCLSKSSFAKIFLIFAAINLILRAIFLIWQHKEIEFGFLMLVKIFSVGLFFDFLTACYIFTPIFIYYIIIPSRIFNSKIHQNINKTLYFILLYAVLFGFVAEITFWDEFQTRFNFIAVDYLIYTTEVVKNIVESYPLGWLLSGIFAVAAAIFYFTHKKIIITKNENFIQALKCQSLVPLLTVIAFFAVDSAKLTQISANNYVNEIAANGTYQLFWAYRNNKVNFAQLYSTIDHAQALQNVRADIPAQEPKTKFTNKNDITRIVPAYENGDERRYNIMFVSIESFSADFMKYFQGKMIVFHNIQGISDETFR